MMAFKRNKKPLFFHLVISQMVNMRAFWKPSNVCEYLYLLYLWM